jgi:hypothetical protein
MSFNEKRKLLVGDLIQMNKELRPLKLASGIAVSDNKLVNACYRMTSVQKRLFNMAIASCTSNRFLESGEVVVNIYDFAELTGKTVKESLRICRQEADGMSQLRVVDIVYKEKRTKFKPFQNADIDKKEDNERDVARLSYKNFFQEVEYIDVEDQCLLYFKFSDWLIPYVENIRKKFAQVPLIEVSRLTSFYSLRLFDFVMATKPIGKVCRRVFSYQEFREVLGFVGDKKDLYPNWCDFRKRCITSSINELGIKATGYEWAYKITGRGDAARKICITATKKDQIPLPLEKVVDDEVEVDGEDLPGLS